MDQAPGEPQDTAFRIGPGYPAMQLARALTQAAHGDDPALRARAHAKAMRWTTALLRFVGGTVAPGSRTPVAGLPAWVTLEVMTGGFATGDVLAGGPLLDHELALMGEIGIPTASATDARKALNVWFLTEAGLRRLGDWVQSERYEVGVPEEGALAVVSCLLRQGQAEQARAVVDALAPYFDRMRFYPKPSDRLHRSGARVALESAGATAAGLAALEARRRILEHQESVTVWTPLYDEVVALFLETVAGEAPVAQRDATGAWLRNQAGGFVISGGWPCAQYPSGWHLRAQMLLDRYQGLRAQHVLCKRPEQTRSSLGLLLDLLRRCVTTPARFSGRDAGRVRLTLARYLAKRGVPFARVARVQRQRERAHATLPTHNLIARQLARRLRAYPAAEGLEDIAPLVKPIDAVEAAATQLPAGTLIPASLARKVERCLIDTVDELLRRRLISSAEVLARLLPQLSSGLRAQGIPDPALRSLYAEIYKAFRRRRSLLLLNLEKQVQLEELPWVAAIDALRQGELSRAELAEQALTELATLAITSFPHTVLPNKLVRELDSLAQTGGLNLPMTEEVAADIFMGRFSEKYAQAAHQAWQLLGGTLYARYYGIDADPSVAGLGGGRAGVGRLPSAEAFSARCSERAGPRPTHHSVAYNGCIIEQQQILTTHNLAVLVRHLALQETLAPRQLESLAQSCFAWVLERLQIRVDDWHARLIHVGNAAYAWRQMIFLLALCPDERVAAFRVWADALFEQQPAAFKNRFRPAIAGLAAAASGSATASSSDAKVFLGWSAGRHWLA